jgi:hypothetical protein
MNPELPSLEESSDTATAHDFQRSRFAGVLTCQRCGLLPLDSDDLNLPCEPPASEPENDPVILRFPGFPPIAGVGPSITAIDAEPRS